MTDTPAVFREADVTAALDLAAVTDAVEAAVAAEAAGRARNIDKTMTTWDTASSAHSLGAVDTASGTVAFKSWVNTPAGASAVVTVFDAADGRLLAVVEAGALGALRTAAISAVATRWLARPDATEAAVVGSGRQALRQVEAVVSARPIRAVRVWSPSVEHRATFARQVTDRVGIAAAASASLDEAVDGADVVTLVTRAREPFLRADALSPGAHLNAVGAILPRNAEFDPALLHRSRLTVVDNLPNAQRSSRELREHFGEDWSTVRTLGEVVTGAAKRADDDPGPTVFKALGMGLADLAAVTAFLRVVQPERFEAA
ncbi:ornithine cyclodeaminase family protein [Jatrophihabitans sp. YIM 134969]